MARRRLPRLLVPSVLLLLALLPPLASALPSAGPKLHYGPDSPPPGLRRVEVAPLNDSATDVEQALYLYHEAARRVHDLQPPPPWMDKSLGIGRFAHPPPHRFWRNISAQDRREDLGKFLDELRTFKGLGLHSDNVNKGLYHPPSPPRNATPLPPHAPPPLTYENALPPFFPAAPPRHPPLENPPELVDPPSLEEDEVRDAVRREWEAAFTPATPPPAAPLAPGKVSYSHGYRIPRPDTENPPDVAARHDYKPGSYCAENCVGIDDAGFLDVFIKADAPDLDGNSPPATLDGGDIFSNQSATTCLHPRDFRVRGDKNRELVLIGSWRGHGDDIIFEFLEQMSGFLGVRNDMSDRLWESKGYKYVCSRAKSLALSGRALFVAVGGNHLRSRTFANDPSVLHLIESDLYSPPPPPPPPPLAPGVLWTSSRLKYTSADDALAQHNVRLRGPAPQPQPRRKRRGRYKERDTPEDVQRKKDKKKARSEEIKDPREVVVKVQSAVKAYRKRSLRGTVEYLTGENETDIAYRERTLCDYSGRIPMNHPTEYPLVNKAIYLIQHPVDLIVREWVEVWMPEKYHSYKVPRMRYQANEGPLLPISFAVYHHKNLKGFTIDKNLLKQLRMYMIDRLDEWGDHFVGWHVGKPLPYTVTSFAQFARDPRREYERIAAFLGIPGLHGDTGVPKAQQHCAMEAMRYRIHEEQQRTWRMLQYPFNGTVHFPKRVDHLPEFKWRMAAQKEAFDMSMHLLHVEFCVWLVVKNIRHIVPPEFRTRCEEAEAAAEADRGKRWSTSKTGMKHGPPVPSEEGEEEDEEEVKIPHFGAANLSRVVDEDADEDEKLDMMSDLASHWKAVAHTAVDGYSPPPFPATASKWDNPWRGRTSGADARFWDRDGLAEARANGHVVGVRP